MFVYKLSQNLNDDYDTFDSCIVIADTQDEAIKYHPDGDIYFEHGFWVTENSRYKKDYTWVDSDQLHEIKIELIGVACKSIKKGVLLSSFNAG